MTRPTANGGSPAGEHKETLKEKRARLQVRAQSRCRSRSETLALRRRSSCASVSPRKHDVVSATQKMKEKRAQSGAGRSSSSDNLKALAGALHYEANLEIVPRRLG